MNADKSFVSVLIKTSQEIVGVQWLIHKQGRVIKLGAGLYVFEHKEASIVGNRNNSGQPLPFILFGVQPIYEFNITLKCFVEKPGRFRCDALRARSNDCRGVLFIVRRSAGTSGATAPT